MTFSDPEFICFLILNLSVMTSCDPARENGQFSWDEEEQGRILGGQQNSND